MEKKNNASLPSNKNTKTSKRKPQPLTSEFYESLFNLETQFRCSENPALIKSITTKYVQAIEYCEYIEDPKCADYQNRLKNFLAKTEVIKHLQKRKQQTQAQTQTQTQTEAQTQNQETNVVPPQSHSPEKNKQVIRNTDMRIKFNFFTQMENLISGTKKLEIEAKKIMEEQNQENENKKTADMINNELTKQQDAFKERLKRIKKNKEDKKALISSPNADNQPSIDNKKDNNDLSPILSVPSHGSQSPTDEQQQEAQTDILPENPIPNLDEQQPNEPIESELIIETVTKEDKKENDSISSFESLDNNESDDEDANKHNQNKDHLNIDINARTSQLFSVIDSNDNIGPKQQKCFLEIKETLDQYVDEFNSYFYKELFTKFAKQTKSLMDEKFNKYIEITKMYQNQIQDIKAQLTEMTNVDSQEYKALENAIESLKEEQRNELDVIEDEYNEKIENVQKNFRQNEFKTNPGVLLLEEQFQLNMCNKISDAISPGI